MTPLTLLSAALTRISSKILKKPGTKVVFLGSNEDTDDTWGHHAHLHAICLVSESKTHIG